MARVDALGRASRGRLALERVVAEIDARDAVFEQPAFVAIVGRRWMLRVDGNDMPGTQQLDGDGAEELARSPERIEVVHEQDRRQAEPLRDHHAFRDALETPSAANRRRTVARRR